MPPPSQNRYSSDSWNSSNYSGMEDLEAEWSPEQTRLLIRVSTSSHTMPAHILFLSLPPCLHSRTADLMCHTRPSTLFLRIF